MKLSEIKADAEADLTLPSHARDARIILTLVEIAEAAQPTRLPTGEDYCRECKKTSSPVFHLLTHDEACRTGAALAKLETL